MTDNMTDNMCTEHKCQSGHKVVSVMHPIVGYGVCTLSCNDLIQCDVVARR